jgi:ribosomal protein S5
MYIITFNIEIGWDYEGDKKGHVGIGVKVAKEAPIAMQGATIAAKLAIIPIRLFPFSLLYLLFSLFTYLFTFFFTSNLFLFFFFICVLVYLFVLLCSGYWGNNIGNPHTVAMKVTGLYSICLFCELIMLFF